MQGDVSDHSPYADGRDELQRLQERDQVGFLLLSQVQIESLVIEIDCVVECCCASIVKIGSARSQTAKDWTF